jgi:hypothetical protein
MPPIRHLTPRRLLGALAAALALAVAPPAAAQSTSTVALGVNTAGMYTDMGAALDGFAARAGSKPTIAMYYQDWYTGWSTALLNPRLTDPIHQRGATPMVTWTPMLDTGDPVNQPAYSLARIIAGAHDAYIRRAAREAYAYGRPFYLRLAHEMNGNWTPWGAGVNGNTPTQFIAMWRRVVDIFRQERAVNVKWVWSPNVVTSYNNIRAFEPYYPGDGYVDFVALDGYNWGSTRSSGWRDFATVFGSSYTALTRMTTKPIMIAEVASAEAGGSKAAWIRAIPEVLRVRMPRVRAMVWFDRLKETDWRIDSSIASRDAFRAILKVSPFVAGTTSTTPTTTLASPTTTYKTKKR